MNRLMQFVAKIAVGKQLVGALAWAHNKTDGRKSQIILAAMALVYALSLVGVLTKEQAHAIEMILAPILPVTLADKAAKIKATLDNVIPSLPEKK